MVDTLLDTLLQCERFSGTEDDDDNLPRLKDGLDTNSQSHSRHSAQIVVKEARVGQDSVISQSLDPGAAGETRSWLVEGNMSVFANASKEKINAASRLDCILVCVALGLWVGRIAIKDVDVGRMNVDMGKEMLPHKGVIGMRVVSRQSDVLVHVEGDDIFERDL